MTGPAVDVEQLQRLADEASEVAEWPWSADFAGTVFDNAGFPIAGDVEDSDAALIVAAVNNLPALLAALRDRDDLIRRQDAALTAVRQLHVEGPYKDCRECSHAWPCPTAILASPDTTQDGGA